MTEQLPASPGLAQPTPALKHLGTELAALLDSQRREIDLSRGDSRIRRTIAWLATTQNADGSWGPGGIASTALIVVALDRVSRFIADVAPDNPPDIDLACQYLISSYQSQLFDNAAWDVAVCGRALLTHLTQTTQPVIDSIRSKLIGTIGHLANAGPHHAAQRTIFLAEAASVRDILTSSAEDLFAATARSLDSLTPYSKAQTLIAASKVYDTVPDRHAPLVNRIASDLKSFLTSTSLDSANFINICSSIHALSDYVEFSHRETLKTSTASLFGETCFRENGTWYYDHLSTAWALLALTSYSVEVVVVAPYAELRSRASTLTAEAIDSVNRERRALAVRVSLATFSIGVAGVLLSIYITWSTLASINWDWAAWALPSATAVLFVTGTTRLTLISRSLGIPAFRGRH